MPNAWLSNAEMTARFGASRIALATGGDDNVLTAAIARAESRVKSELVALRYQPADLPTTPETASEPLKRVTGGWAWHYLNEAKSIYGDDIREVLRDARDELKSIANGSLSLLLAGEPPVDHARPTIHTGRVSTSYGGERRPTLDGCWEGFED